MTDVFPRRNLPGTADVWGREVEIRVAGAERSAEINAQSLQALNRSLASSVTILSEQVSGLAEVIAALPYQVAQDRRESGFALSGSYADKVSDTILVPPGKTSVSVMCIATGAALDTTTGGLTTAYGRVVINGQIGGASPAAKDSGATFVNNVITSSFALTFGVTPGDTVTVSFQMYGLNGSAFPAQPANFAQIATVATFT